MVLLLSNRKYPSSDGSTVSILGSCNTVAHPAKESKAVSMEGVAQMSERIELKHIQKANFPDLTLCGKQRFKDGVKFGIGNRGTCPECLVAIGEARKRGATHYMKTESRKKQLWLEGEFKLPLGDGNPGGKR